MSVEYLDEDIDLINKPKISKKNIGQAPQKRKFKPEVVKEEHFNEEVFDSSPKPKISKKNGLPFNTPAKNAMDEALTQNQRTNQLLHEVLNELKGIHQLLSEITTQMNTLTNAFK